MTGENRRDSVRCVSGINCREVRSMLPTVIILLATLVILFTVIPYAFASVIRQMEAAQVITVQ